MKLTINVDIDGVVYDFVGIMREMTEASPAVAPRKLGEVESWNMWEHWGMERDEWYEHFHANIRDGLFARGQAIPGAVNAVMGLVEDGHRVRFVTSKKMRHAKSTMRAQQQTTEWLYANGLIQVTELCFTSNKQGYPADVVIDDKGDLSWVQEGASNLLYDQPWNADLLFDPLATVHWSRMHSWQQVLTEISALSG